jgi:hypothetical protein
MHTAEELRSSFFRIALAGRAGHKEVVVDDEAERILEAANDRAITRLVVKDGGPADAAFERETLASNPVTEGYVEAVLDPDATAARAGEVEPKVRARIRDGRAALAEDGVPVETYRRIGLDEALALLTAGPA